MGKVAEVRSAPEKRISGLGRKLRRISDRIAASGEKPLTRREVEKELAERRGGVR